MSQQYERLRTCGYYLAADGSVRELTGKSRLKVEGWCEVLQAYYNECHPDRTRIQPEQLRICSLSEWLAWGGRWIGRNGERTVILCKPGGSKHNHE